MSAKSRPGPRPPAVAIESPPSSRATTLVRLALVLVAAALVGSVSGLLASGLNDGAPTPSASTTTSLQVVDTLRQSAHEHADFAVYVRGQRFDFNKPQFLSTEDTERSPNVHLHAPRTNVLHIHREQNISELDRVLITFGPESAPPELEGGSWRSAAY